MSLKNQVTNYLINNLFAKIHVPGEWKVLILDRETTKLISSALKMNDIVKYGVVHVESLYVERQPFKFEAIYIIDTSVESLNYIAKDFNEQVKMYTQLHIFFLKPCSPEIIETMRLYPFMTYVKTCQQLDLSFIAVESHLYSLDERDIVKKFYASQLEEKYMNNLADRMVTLCSLIGENPKIYYKNNEPNNEAFAKILQQKLDQAQKENPQMGRLPHQDRSIILVLDRSIDPVAPLSHFATLQAFAYDLFQPKDNTIMINETKSYDLTKDHEYWKDFRHEHIGNFEYIVKYCKENFEKSTAVQIMKKNRKKIDANGRVNEGADFSSEGDSIRMTDLQEQLKAVGKFQDESDAYESFITLLNKLLTGFNDSMVRIAQMEQRLTLVSVNAQDIGPIINLVPTPLERARLILYFLLSSKECLGDGLLSKLIEFAKFNDEYKKLIISISKLINARLVSGNDCTDPVLKSLLNHKDYLKLPLISSVLSSKPEIQNYLVKNNKRVVRNYEDFEISKYPPYLEDVLEFAIRGKLDQLNQFTALKKSNEGLGTMSGSSMTANRLPNETGPIMTARNRGGGQKNMPNQQNSNQINIKPDVTRDHIGPRIIVCMLGGISWGEIRSAYHINRMCMKARYDASEKAGNPEQHKKKFGLFSEDRHIKTQDYHSIPDGGNIGWNWEVIVGGTHFLSPKDYIDDLFDIYNSTFEAGDNNPFPL